MSLFNALEYWSTRCGENETFGFESMVVTDLLETGKDLIIIGSYNGFLRIYQTSNSENEPLPFKASDLLLETELPNTICQVVVGKLISGSKTPHIGVAFPLNVAVYSFSTIAGTTEHGNQFEFKMIYEHPLRHASYQLIVGSFGGVKNRDFLCVVALDGTLTFFEQETLVFETRFPNFLLPSLVTYIEDNDIFVTLSANFCLEAYRYEDLVNTAKKKVNSIWSCNLGENIIGLQTTKQEKETRIVALSEHNISCFGINGKMKFTKRLQYTPSCFHVYVNESNSKLITLVVSDGGFIYIYDQCTLLWSAKLPVVPICVSKAKLAVNGSLVLLSDQGDVRCCYLGTTPTLFIAPPFESTVSVHKSIAIKLEKTQEEIESFKKKHSSSSSLITSEPELSVIPKIQSSEKFESQLEVLVKLLPSCPVSNLHVFFEASAPFCFHLENHKFSTLCDNSTVTSLLQVKKDEEIFVPSSLEIIIVVCYSVNNLPRVIRRKKNIPLSFLLLPCTPHEEKNIFKIEIELNKTCVPLSQLFQDFKNFELAENMNSDENIGFFFRYKTDLKCFISLSKSKQTYEFATNSFPLLNLLLTQIISRCKKKKTISSTNREELIFFTKDLPKNELMQSIKNYCATRSEIHNLQVFLEKLSAQYRLIQRRLLIKLKDKVSCNMEPIRILHRSTHDKLIETISAIEEKENNLIISSNELQSILNLILELIPMNNLIPLEKFRTFRNAVLPTVLNLKSQKWEEQAKIHLMYLSRTSLNYNPRASKRNFSATKVTLLTLLENLIITAIDPKFLEISPSLFRNQEKQGTSRRSTTLLVENEYS